MVRDPKSRGASAREVKSILFDAAQNAEFPCLSPLAVLREIESFTKRVSEYDFLKQDVKDGYHDAVEFITTVRNEYLNRIDSEVRESIGWTIRIAPDLETTAAPSDEELDGARRYLIGTFPLRFGAAPPVAAAASGLTAIGLELAELDRYRDAVAAVDRAAGVRIAEELEAETERIVVVGDAAAVRAPLEAEGFAVEVQE